MFCRFRSNSFFVYVTAIFIALSLVILPTQTVFANEEAEKHNDQGCNYYNSGNYEAAVKEHLEAIKIEPTISVYYNNLAWAYYKLGKYTEAEENFKKAIQLLGTNESSFAYNGLANVYRAMGKNEEAKNYFIESAKHFYSVENYERAKSDLAEAIALGASDAEIYYLRGKSYFHSGNYDEALNCFNEVIKIDDSYADAYRERAAIYLERGDIDEAKIEFSEAGQKYFVNDEYDKAKEALEQVIELDPNYGEAYFYLGQVENRQGRYEKAIPYYDEAIRLGLDEGYVYVCRGWCNYKLKKYKEAIADYDKVKETDEHYYSNACEDRGLAYFDSDEFLHFVYAKDNFKKYLELEGENLDEEDKKIYEDKIQQCIDNSFIARMTEIKVIDSLFNEEMSWLLKSLLIVIVVDYVVIISCRIKNRTLTLGMAGQEFAVKIILLLILIVAIALGELMSEISNIVIAMMVVYQLLSIIENSGSGEGHLGLPIPEWLNDLVNKIKKWVDDKFFS